MSISNPAKILAAYMRCSGVTDAKALADHLDIPIRTIQRLKLEVACAAANDATCAISGAHKPPNAPDMAPPDTPDTPDMALPAAAIAHASITTRATKESPSEIVITSKLDSPLVPQAAELQASATIAEPHRKPSSNTKRGSRLEPGWKLPDDWRMWARTNFVAATPEQIDDQAAQFHDYWISKPGAQAAKLDWEATWRNWCRRGLSQLNHVRKPQTTGVFERKRLDLSKIKTYDYEPGAVQ